MRKITKGIVLAGGLGTRLNPSTKIFSKHFIPIFDKPMIYYSLSTLMLSGIRDIAIVSDNDSSGLYKKLIGKGKQWGINIEYFTQEKPRGIAEVFIIVRDFIHKNYCTLILGDNLFFGHNFQETLISNSKFKDGAKIYAYQVSDPKNYGVINFNKKGKITKIEEKPKKPKSKYAVTGLYSYDDSVFEIAKDIKPSKRGELEITDINNFYLKKNKLSCEILGRGIAWLDTGTFEDILNASNFVQTIEKRQGLKIACLEEIAWRKKWVSSSKLLNYLPKKITNSYDKYIYNLIKDTK
tara:strand:+ start:9999 stop:10883 length:885 start_codon:yes stop_codon:yes gene_type:complete